MYASDRDELPLMFQAFVETSGSSNFASNFARPSLLCATFAVKLIRGNTEFRSMVSGISIFRAFSTSTLFGTPRAAKSHSAEIPGPIRPLRRGLPIRVDPAAAPDVTDGRPAPCPAMAGPSPDRRAPEAARLDLPARPGVYCGAQDSRPRFGNERWSRFPRHHPRTGARRRNGSSRAGRSPS